MAANSRSQDLQLLHGERKVQDGDSRVNKTSSSTRRLGHFPGFHISLSPHSHPQKLQKVSSVCNKQCGIPIQSLTDGSHVIGQDIYKDNKSHSGDGSKETGTFAPVFRRLADQGEVPGVESDTHRPSAGVSHGLRFQVESGQVRVNPNTRDYLSGIQLLVEEGPSSTLRSKVGEDKRDNSAIHAVLRAPSLELAVSDRPTSLNREAGSPGPPSPATPTVGSHRSLVANSANSGYPHPDHTSGTTRAGLVAEERECDARSAIGSSSSSASYLYGRFLPGLGRTFGQVGSARVLGCTGEIPTHQCTGDVSCSICYLPLQRVSCAQHCFISHGQHHCNVLHTQARGDEVQSPLENNSDVIRSVKSTQHRTELSTYRRETEHDSGQALEARSNSSHRMELTPCDPGSGLADLEQTNDRLVCNPGQQKDAVVCVSNSRSGGLGSGCSQPELEPVICICLSSDSDSSASAKKGADVELRDYSDSPGLAKTAVVCQHSGALNRLATKAPNTRKNAKTTKVRHLSPEPSVVPISCLEVIKQSHQAKGFSESAATRMARAQKDSTLAIYQGKWNIFNTWCVENKFKALEVTAPIVADFLCHLRDKKDLATSTIEGYRTAISHVVKAVSGIDLGKDQQLTSLINNLGKADPSRKSTVPNWDLSLVLLMLTKAPFEPLHLAELKYLTFKTVFLLALASGRRRGELHALQAEIQRTEHWSEITIYTDPEFISKTQLRVKGGAAMTPLTLRALTKSLSPDLQEDRSLCVVRAIKYYLNRTKDTRKGRKRLFLAYKKGFSGDITKNTVSSWIKNTILLTYERSTAEIQQVSGVRAHDVRGMASSWALLRNVSLDAILEACSWKCHNTFTHYYLKDLSRIQGEMLKLGPVVAALHTV